MIELTLENGLRLWVLKCEITSMHDCLDKEYPAIRTHLYVGGAEFLVKEEMNTILLAEEAPCNERTTNL